MLATQIVPDTSPVYLLCSSETLLLRDWLDQARSALREAGFAEISNHSSDTGFDWEDLINQRDMMSLFSDKSCSIININNGKPGQLGSKVIQSLCADPPEDKTFIFVVPTLDRQSKNASWVKAIKSAGVVVELAPVYDNQLADWIIERARLKSLTIDRQSALFLAERTEGNLLAADQELEKLSIRFSGEAAVDYDTIESSVAQSARYSHFLLVDACLSGKQARALKILNSLRAEGYATVQLCWAFKASLEQLDRLKQAQQSGALNDRLWQQLRIWRNKQSLYQSALQRLSAAQIERLLQSCATLDRLGKGQQDSEYPDQDWSQIESLIAAFTATR